MDTFLTDLYDRGISKVAVAGTSTPPCPTGTCVKTLNADSKAPAKKTTPPEEPTAKTATIRPNLLGAAGLSHGVVIPGIIGSAYAPEGEGAKGAVRGALMGTGAMAGGAAGVSLAEKALGQAFNAPTSKKGQLLKALSLLGTGAGGMYGGHALGKAVLPYDSEKTKKAEMILTAMRATRTAPGHIKQAAAKYLGRKLAVR